MFIKTSRTVHSKGKYCARCKLNLDFFFLMKKIEVQGDQVTCPKATSQKNSFEFKSSFFTTKLEIIWSKPASSKDLDAPGYLENGRFWGAGFQKKKLILRKGYLQIPFFQPLLLQIFFSYLKILPCLTTQVTNSDMSENCAEVHTHSLKDLVTCLYLSLFAVSAWIRHSSFQTPASLSTRRVQLHTSRGNREIKRLLELRVLDVFVI